MKTENLHQNLKKPENPSKNVYFKLEGWLNVCEKAVEQRSHGACSVYQVRIPWHQGYCVIRQDEKSFVCYKNEQSANRVARHLPRIRLDKGYRAFCWRQGLAGLFAQPSSPTLPAQTTMEIEEEGHQSQNDVTALLNGNHDEKDFKQVEECAIVTQDSSTDSSFSIEVISLHESIYSTINGGYPKSNTSYDLIEASSSSCIDSHTLERRGGSVAGPAGLPESSGSPPITEAPRSGGGGGWPYRRMMPSFQTSAPPAFNVLLGHTIGTMSLSHGQHGHHNHHHQESPSSSHKIVNFFSRPFRSNPLKRTKSVSKLDRIKRSALDTDCHGWSHHHCPASTSSSNTVDPPYNNFHSPCHHNRYYNNGQRYQYGGYGGCDATNANCANNANHAAYAISNNNNNCGGGGNIRNSRSHESLLTYSTTTHAIDLSANGCTVTPLHSSVLGAPHCFQIRTNTGATKYYACRTAGERNRWLESLRSMQPNHDQIKRQENSLQLWIFAAKGIQCKRRYYCELCLDKTLYCRTTSKLKSSDECFWGEQFEINHLPKLETLCINLYREADRKKRKDRNALIGYVQIPVALLVVRHPIEKWYVIAGGEKPNKNESPSVRIKARYQSVTILPLRFYDSFLQFIKRDYLSLCSAVENLTSVKSKEDIATCLVHILHKLRLAKDFLCDLVMAEVESLDNYHLMFRGNSLATKAMEAYMKLVGDQYLHDTLSEFVQSVIDSDEECEVDPNKVANFLLLEKHRDTLTRQVHLAWGKIVNSFYEFPVELRLVFYELRNRLNKCNRSDLADYLISSNIFLRFLCPAVLSPNLFNLIQEYPNEKTVRNLTLIAKTVQTLANFTKFGVKEQYMEFMNKFIEGEVDHMRQYLARISSAPTQDYISKCMEWEGCVDLGKELSLLHSYLLESWQHVEKSFGPTKSAELRRLLDQLNDCLENLARTPSGYASSPMTDTPTSPISDYENNITTTNSSGAGGNNGNYSNGGGSGGINQSGKSNESSPSAKSRSSGELTPHFKLPKNSNNNNSGSNYSIRNGCASNDCETVTQKIDPNDDGEINNSNSRFYFPASPAEPRPTHPSSSNHQSPIATSSSIAPTTAAANQNKRRNTTASSLMTSDDYVWRAAIDENVGLRRTGVVVQQNRLRCPEAQGLRSAGGHSKSSPASPDVVTAASAVVGAAIDGFTFADDHHHQQQQQPHRSSGNAVDSVHSSLFGAVVDSVHSQHPQPNQTDPFIDSDHLSMVPAANLRGSRGSLTTNYTQTASSSGYQSLNYSTSNSSSPVDNVVTGEIIEKKGNVVVAAMAMAVNGASGHHELVHMKQKEILATENHGTALSISNPLYCMQTVPLIKQKSSTCYSLPDIQRHVDESSSSFLSPQTVTNPLNQLINSTNSFPPPAVPLASTARLTASNGHHHQQQQQHYSESAGRSTQKGDKNKNDQWSMEGVDVATKNRYSLAAQDKRRLYQRAKTVLSPTNNENVYKSIRNGDDFYASAATSGPKSSPAPRTNPRYVRSHSQNAHAVATAINNGLSPIPKQQQQQKELNDFGGVEVFCDENLPLNNGHVMDHDISNESEESARKHGTNVHYKVTRSDVDREKNSSKYRPLNDSKLKWTEQVKPILSRLKVVEFELQEEINASTRKEMIIEAQRKRIEQLQSKNETLLSTLNDLKQQQRSSSKSSMSNGDGSPKSTGGHVTDPDDHHRLYAPSTISSSSLSTDSISSMVLQNESNSMLGEQEDVDDDVTNSTVFYTPIAADRQNGKKALRIGTADHFGTTDDHQNCTGVTSGQLSPQSVSSNQKRPSSLSANVNNGQQLCQIINSTTTMASIRDGCDNIVNDQPSLSPTTGHHDNNNGLPLSPTVAKLDFTGLKTTEC